MSISNLFSPNGNSIYAKEFIGELNGIQGQVITGLNIPGQVLTIVSTDPKVVSFQDPEGVPSSVGFPNGYVLKIIDNATNEVNWEPDSVGGAVVPFILTGNSFTAFQVRNNAFEQSIIIDSTINTVQLPGTTRVEGVDTLNKFGVYNNADSINPEFVVDTVNHQVKISGPDDTEKFAVYNPADPFPIFSVNSSEAILTIRADGESIIELVPIDNTINVSDTSNSNISTIQLKNQNGINDRLTITHTNDGTNISQIKCTNLNMDSKVNVIGSDVKDKFTVSNLAGDKEFKVDTNGGIISCKILGANSGEKLRVLNFTDKPIFNVNTVGDIVESQGNLLLRGIDGVNKILVQNNTGVDVFKVDTVNKQTIIPTATTLEITDLPLLDTNATNKLYVDNKFSSPRVPSNIMTYVNELPGNGTLPSVPTPTAQVAFSQFLWTGSTLITSTPLNFTVVSPGVLRYDGTDTRWFNINIEIGVVSAAADQVVQVVLLDAVDAIIPASLSQFYTSTNDRNGGSSVNIALQLSNLNQIKVAVRTPRAATSLTIENYKLQIIEN